MKLDRRAVQDGLDLLLDAMEASPQEVGIVELTLTNTVADEAETSLSTQSESVLFGVFADGTFSIDERESKADEAPLHACSSEED